MPEPHDLTAIRTTRHQIEAQLMAGTYCTPVDDTEPEGEKVMSAKCKNCHQPIKYIGWRNLWTHDVLGTDNQIACLSYTFAEPSK